MVWPFSKKQEPVIALPMPTKEELLSIAESLSERGVAGAIEQSMQKQIDNSQYFQAYENADDGGNFFGTEFNIRATAGRIKGTYSREPWMYASATLIARTLASVPFIVVNNATDEPDPTHPLNAKLNLGNRLEDEHTLTWKGYLDLILGGNFFRIYNETFTECFLAPVELVTLKLTPDKLGIESVMLYDQARAGYSTLIPYKQCIHHKYPNPYNPFYGLSIFTAASRPLLLDRYKSEFEMAFYLRGATNSGVIETTEDINKTRMDRLMRTFEAVYTGKRNWWRTIFLPKGAKWIQSGLTMSEMQHLEGLRENRLSILAVLGVPPSQLGITQDVNRATSETQERSFWINTIKPLAQFVASGWNNSYLVKTIYGGSVRVEPDFSEVQALQGSLITKGEQAKSVEGYLWIDEIRKDILGYDELPNGAGQKFVAEIKSASPASPFALAAPTEVADPAQQIIAETEPATLGLKARVAMSQERIESKLTADYLSAYEAYLEKVLDLTEFALLKNLDLRGYLKQNEEKLARNYMFDAEPVLQQALERGFSFAASQVKTIRTVKNLGSIKAPRFSDTDQQAIDALRDKQRDGKRSQLAQRAIDSFIGMNETRSNQVLDIVATGLENGETTEAIARTIRDKYGEAYKDQAFTIARTELLTSVSQGIKWNHDVLGQVFTKTKKQWFHVGKDKYARDNHIGFEGEGEVDSDYRWGGILSYPRDPSAPAEETINCRCSMVTVIPDDAESNAEVILDNL